ncbi:endonuclease domain-containing protein [Sphingomonas sp.]|uniref:endonuclease domain-containing protein n=1 Tax=Sphingomonas sp. TaxID=28214 RepID=UPI002DD68286|nr:endonuclease domain-containing protein [Sphingomonas sp.]
MRGNVEGLTKRQLLPPLTVLRSRELRRNATEVEKRFRRAIREAAPVAKFRFQVPIGPYHADFCSHRARLIVELDGGQHDEERDARRTQYLEGEGYRVIRFWNNDVVENLEGAILRVLEHLGEVRA